MTDALLRRTARETSSAFDSRDARRFSAMYAGCALSGVRHRCVIYRRAVRRTCAKRACRAMGV
ncbi:hypothetical protein AQ860_07935 [Burkholderia pseudomallei]|nr:hypothetical protein AQ760_15815 [Burkholderia pseudomallei]OMZ20174.1 hypothetical protein AQ859_06075 [Burkholderia pseudomallei]OMZ23557.1 hypothetical protein AQ860_07935 [Burkholderia pseudomallei]ONC63643.1 hypothetical protein AQ919_30085 [Burkholderia pseudomallei]